MGLAFGDIGYAIGRHGLRTRLLARVFAELGGLYHRLAALALLAIRNALARSARLVLGKTGAFMMTLFVNVPDGGVAQVLVDKDIIAMVAFSIAVVVPVTTAVTIPIPVTRVVPAAMPVSVIEVMVMPVEVIPQPRAHRIRLAEVNRRIVCWRRICIDYFRVIARLVDIVRLCRDDADDGLINDIRLAGYGTHVLLDLHIGDALWSRCVAGGRIVHHGLLRSAHQVSERLGLGSQCLDGIHHIGRLVRKGVPQLGGPGQIFIQPCEGVGIVGEGLYARIPRLAVHSIGTATRSDEAVGKDDVRWHRGCRKH